MEFLLKQWYFPFPLIIKLSSIFIKVLSNVPSAYNPCIYKFDPRLQFLWKRIVMYEAGRNGLRIL